MINYGNVIFQTLLVVGWIPFTADADIKVIIQFHVDIVVNFFYLELAIFCLVAVIHKCECS